MIDGPTTKEPRSASTIKTRDARRRAGGGEATVQKMDDGDNDSGRLFLRYIVLS